MALVDKGTRQKLSSVNPPQGNCIAGSLAAEDIEYGAACRLTSSGIVNSVGDEDVDGFAMKPASATEPLTLLKGGERMRYGASLAVGTNLYLDAALDGRLNTTPGTAGTPNATRVARVIEPNVIAVYERHLS